MPEDDQSGRRTAAGPDMRTAGSVACLALQTAVTEGPAWIVRARVPGTEDTGDRGIIVTAKTGIGARWAVGGVGGICGICGICGCDRAREQSECSDDAGTRDLLHSSA